MNYYPSRGRTSFPCQNPKARTLGNKTISKYPNLNSILFATTYFKHLKHYGFQGKRYSNAKKNKNKKKLWAQEDLTTNKESSNKVRPSFWLRLTYCRIRVSSRITIRN